MMGGGGWGGCGDRTETKTTAHENGNNKLEQKLKTSSKKKV